MPVSVMPNTGSSSVLKMNDKKMMGNEGTIKAENHEKNLSFDKVYEKKDQLGDGNFGVVHKCFRRNDDCNSKSSTAFAVKICDRTVAKWTTKQDTSTLREVQIMKDLSDGNVPNVTCLIDFFVEPGAFYIVQNLATGGELFIRIIERTAYTECDARALAKNLLLAMDAIHHLSPSPIIHRDLKPENLLLRDPHDDTSVIVADFGLARHVPPEGCTTLCGTIEYSSPEVLRGVTYGVAADMWSIGCIIYFLVGGEMPFFGKNHRESERRIRAANFYFYEDIFGGVSTSVKKMIQNLLNVDTISRWSARKCLESEWFQFKDGDLASNDLRGSIVRLKKMRARQRWKAAKNAIGWAANQKFWAPDAVSFADQMKAWDKAALSKSSLPAPRAFMAHIPNLKFEDVYELKNQIKQGEIVWQAVHKATGGLFAVKVVNRDGFTAVDEETVLNEVAIMQQMSGKDGFVQLLDFYEEKDAFYLVMEFMSGGDLEDQLAFRAEYTEKYARDLIKSLLQTVSVMHSTGLAHRGITPTNLLMRTSNDAEVKISNFSYARRVHTPCSLTCRKGAAMYVAPEVVQGFPHDERVDLWSIGVLAYVLLVGRSPWGDGLDKDEVLKRIAKNNWDFPADSDYISDDAKKLVKALLKKQPEKRWSIEKCLNSQWIKEKPETLSKRCLVASLDESRKRRTQLRSLAKTVVLFGQ